MSALARGNDASLVELPREVWSRGSRPLQGRAIRWGVATSVVLLGLSFPMMSVRIGAIATAALVFFGVFPLVDSRLEALGKTLAAASRGEAAKLLAGLEERWMVSRFAPHVWVSAQKGRLNMIKGDSRAAAAAFAEAARQSGNAQQPDLVGSQAHALVLSGDPKGARQLLLGMEERKELRSLDAFNLGVAYVEEPGKTSRAVELLELARKDLGAAPRTDAALALAYARDGKAEDAASLLEAMDESEFGDDDTAKDLHKRARRSLRQATDSKGAKGKRKSDSTGTDAPEDGKPAKGKRDRRKDRREKRKARGGKKSRKGKGSDAAEAEEQKADAVVPDADEPASSEAENAAAVTGAAEKSAAETARTGEAAPEKSEKAASEKAASEKAASEKAAADKAAVEKAAVEKAASEKAAADKTAVEKAAVEKAAADKAAADKAASKKAVEKAAADKAAEEREARAKVVAETLARSGEGDDTSEEKAKAEAEAAARAAAERAREKAEAKAKEGAAPEKPLFGSDSQPLFVPPPVPAFGSDTGPRTGASAATKPAAPKLAAPPKVGPPKVTAPPVVDAAAPKKSSIDTDGWDDLFGDD